VPLLEQVLNKNTENVKIVFKNLPLPNHSMARPAAFAALAAGEQGKFWEYHDALFAEKRITQNYLTELAGTLGLDMQQFEQDRESFKIQSLVARDMKEAQAIGITGTPTIYVNGKKLRERSLPGFQAMIDTALQQVKK